MATSLTELLRKKGLLIGKMKALVDKEDALPEGETMSDEDKKDFDDVQATLTDLNDRIGRMEAVLAAQADAAADIGEGSEGGGEGDQGQNLVDDTVQAGHAPGVRRHGRARVAAEPATRMEKGSFVAACAKMMALGKSPMLVRQTAAEVYGEQHPVTKAITTRAMTAGVGPNGGFMVPPDFVREIIELLRPKCVIRSSGPRSFPMPNGTMTLPKQTQAASASYTGEIASIPVSEETVGQVIAAYKTLAAMVPISNDLLRYSDPQVDAFVRDDLVQVLARSEDLAFIRGDGTQGTPKGLRTFCLPPNKIPSNPTFTYRTAAMELGGAINQLETGNVDMVEPVWIMNPRPKNYLLNVQNDVGAYVFRDEMLDGTLLGVPFKTTTQVPANLAFTSGGTPYMDGTEIYLAEMTQALLLDSMTLELAASTEASYVDANGQQQNAFQQRQTLIRAVEQHDFQMRHDEAVIMIQNVRWAPAIS